MFDGEYPDDQGPSECILNTWYLLCQGHHWTSEEQCCDLYRFLRQTIAPRSDQFSRVIPRALLLVSANDELECCSCSVRNVRFRKDAALSSMDFLGLGIDSAGKQRAAHRLSLSGYNIQHDVSGFDDGYRNVLFGSQPSSELLFGIRTSI